jgi:hypothetical protein
MDEVAPATGTALLLLVAFVLPGFVTVVTREATYVVKDATTGFERLLLSLTYSIRVYGILLVGAWLLGITNRDISKLYHGHSPLRDYIVLAFLGLFALPVFLSESGRRWRKSKRFRPWALERLKISVAHSTLSGWEHFFGSNQEALVRITLDDGRVIAGFFGGDSFAAYSTDSQDLFLEERWELDEDAWFLRPAPLSFGLWVPHEHIVSLEVYAPPGNPPDRLDRAVAAALTTAAVVGAVRSD